MMEDSEILLVTVERYVPLTADASCKRVYEQRCQANVHHVIVNKNLGENSNIQYIVQTTTGVLLSSCVTY